MQQPNLKVLGIQYIASKHTPHNHIYYNSVIKQYKYSCKLLTKLHNIIRSAYKITTFLIRNNMASYKVYSSYKNSYKILAFF